MNKWKILGVVAVITFLTLFSALIYQKNVSEKNISDYMAGIQSSIKENWNPPHGTETNKVVVWFRIDKTGSIVDKKIKVSSNIAGADLAALQAIEDASPFPYLPKSFKRDTIEINFSFDYNVYKTK